MKQATGRTKNRKISQIPNQSEANQRNDLATCTASKHHYLSPNLYSDGSPRVVGMEAPYGRVRPPSGAAQRPQRRLHGFPEAGRPGTTRRERWRAEAEGVEASGRGLINTRARMDTADLLVVGCGERILRKRRPVRRRHTGTGALGRKQSYFAPFLQLFYWENGGCVVCAMNATGSDHGG